MGSSFALYTNQKTKHKPPLLILIEYLKYLCTKELFNILLQSNIK